MAEDKKNSNVEREYVVPLRREWSKVARYKRTNKAVKAVKEFMVRHMKVRDRDLKKVKIDRYLNEELWFRGIKNPPSRIKVKARMDGEFVRVELAELPANLKFKKAREEKRSKKAEEKVKPKEESKEPLTTSPIVEKKEESLEEAKETAEKKASVVAAGEKMEKEAAKKVKHQTKKDKEPKHPHRMTLRK